MEKKFHSYGSLEDNGEGRKKLSKRKISSRRINRQQNSYIRDVERRLSVRGSLRSKPVLRQVLQYRRSGTCVTSRKHSRHHSYLFTMLNPRSRQIQAIFFKYSMSTVIICDMVVFCISTEPKYSNWHFFKVWEGWTSVIFLIEYLCRLLVVTEGNSYKKYNPVLGRLKYLVSGSAIIDALATFPFFIEFFTSYDLPTLTYLRAFRLLRLTKTESFSHATDAVTRVLYYNRHVLYVAVLICFFLIFLTAILLYYAKPPDDLLDENDKSLFQSIPATMYLSALILTGQGGPDGSQDFPWYTKIILLISSFFTVAMIAIPASMLTWGFENEAERLAKKAITKSKRQSLTQNPLDSDSAEDDWSSSSDFDSSDEDYEKIIVGDDDSDEDENTNTNEKISLLNNERATIPFLSKTEILDHLSFAVNQGENIDSKKVENLINETAVRLEAKIDATNERLDQILKNFQSE